MSNRDKTPKVITFLVVAKAVSQLFSMVMEMNWHHSARLAIVKNTDNKLPKR